MTNLLAALPEYDTLPAPLWIVVILHLLTLTLHFVAMNFMFGGIVIVLFGKFENRWQNPVVQSFLKLFPSLMAATVTLGVAPLLFVQLTYGGPVYSASIVSGWLWLLIPVVVIVAYYFLYGSAFAKAGNPKVKGWLLVALLGLLYVSLVYSSVFSMAERPDVQKAIYEGNQSGFALNPNVGDWIFRWLHMVTGAVTVGAFLVGLLGRDDADATAASRRFLVGGMVLAALTGIAYLLTLGDALKPFMKSSGIWSMTAGIVLALGALHFFFKKKWCGAGAMLFVSLGAMVWTRHALRLVVLPEATNPATLYEGKVVPQWDVFAIFVVCFVVALALVWWMLKTFFTDRQGQDSQAQQAEQAEP